MTWNVRRPVVLLIAAVLAFTGAVLPVGAVQAQEVTSAAERSVDPGAIRGVVRGPGGPVKGVRVAAYKKLPRNDGFEWVKSPRTQADGSYRLRGLAPGTYRVRFEDPARGHRAEYWDDAEDSLSATNVVVRAGKTVRRISPLLARGARISGRVTDESGTPLPDVWISAHRGRDGWDAVETSTDAQGRYTLNGLKKGRYRLWFQAAGGQAHEYWKDKATLEDATFIRVKARATLKGRNVVLDPGGQISGHITGKDGADLENVTVDVFRRTEVDKSWVRVAYGHTGQHGRYFVDNLKAGAYRVQFTGPADHEEVFWAGPGKTAGGETGMAKVGAGKNVRVGSGAQVQDIDASLGAYPFRRALKAAGKKLRAPSRPILGQILEVYGEPGRLGQRKVRMKYQWLAGRKAIPGATRKTFKVTAARHRMVTGKRLRVRVTMTVPRAPGSPSRTVVLTLRKTRPVT